MEIILSIYWPHDRCLLGWEFIGPTDEEPINSFIIHLTIITLTINLWGNS
jgi:hypothetical protein